jgi:hypothetical protein
MSTMTMAPAGSRSSSLYDVLELILDKGLVIDAFVRVSLVGIELLTIDVRVVVASVDTYLRFAEAANRLDLQAAKDSEGLPQLVGDMASGGAESKAKGALSGAREAASDWFGGGGDQDRENADRGSESRGSARRGQQGDRQDARRERRARREERRESEGEGAGDGGESEG